MKVDVLIDNKKSFLNIYKDQIIKIINKYSSSSDFYTSVKKIKKGDLLFLLGCEKILDKKKLTLHKLNLVVHPSNLPKGRGSAALIWDILKGKRNFW